jgi:DNA-binding PadR family transcriptional regulator
VLLAEAPMHGYQIMQELDERSGGAWHPSPGSIYPTLQQMSDEGLIIGEAADGKNVFSLTDSGREAVAGIDEPPAWERFGEDGTADVGGLRRVVFQLKVAVHQIALTGGEAQVAEARRIVDDARKALYRLLADDE